MCLSEVKTETRPLCTAPVCSCSDAEEPSDHLQLPIQVCSASDAKCLDSHDAAAMHLPIM